MVEIRKLVDSGENAGVERDRAPSKGQGHKQERSPLQPPEVIGSHCWSCTQFCLWACPSPSRASGAETFIVSLSPEANTELAGEKRAPYRTPSILPEAARGQDPGSGPQPLLSGNCSEHAGDEDMAQHPWLPAVPSLYFPASFAEEQPQPRSHFPLRWSGRLLSFCSFLLRTGIQDREDSLAPKPPPPKILSTLFKSSKLQSSHGPTAHSGSSLFQIKYTLYFLKNSMLIISLSSSRPWSLKSAC